ncbi:Electron transport complex subunit RsxG [Serratia symbiotica]|nr:Electron transport complex subunit RsxG [Serratia symbiotica]
MLELMKKHSTTLAIFAAITTGLTTLVNNITQKTIKNQLEQEQKELLNQIISPDNYDNNIQNECFLLNDSKLDNNIHHLYLARKKGKLSAVILETTAPDGYSGTIKLLVGADLNGIILGSRVIEHHETPGLGDKIELRISNWITLFNGKKVNNLEDKQWAVKKDGGIFDQFTGATITPRAVINSIKYTALYIKTISSKLENLSVCRVIQ